MFLDGSFSFKGILKPFIQGKFLQNNNAIQLVVWEEKIFKGFFTLIAMATILHRTQLFEGI